MWAKLRRRREPQDRGKITSLGTVRYAQKIRLIAMAMVCLALLSRPARAQDEPGAQPSPAPGSSQPTQAPDEKTSEKKKDEGLNPAQTAAEKTKEVTVQAAVAHACTGINLIPVTNDLY